MNNRLNEIVKCLQNIKDICIVEPFVIDGSAIKGGVRVSLKGENLLNFKVEIFHQYPLQFRDSETIRFLNKDLLDYDHVNPDGTICIHTWHSPDLCKKLEGDIQSLKNWIQEYYTEQKKDIHYHHIIVPPSQKETEAIFLFNSLGYDFYKGEYGYFDYSFLQKGKKLNQTTQTYLIQRLRVISDIKLGKDIECQWSYFYKSKPISDTGIFIFTGEAPVKHKRFAINEWNDLKSFVSSDFIVFLHESLMQKKNKGEMPLLIGYYIPSVNGTFEVHWQVILLNDKECPSFINSDRGQKIGSFRNTRIDWGETKNISYSYFFGRGKLNSKFTDAKILLIGLGAIGSAVATTLTRGGCTKLFIADYDNVEPETVCRSEYFFSSGVNSKVIELTQILYSISPYVDVQSFSDDGNILKVFHDDQKAKDVFAKQLNSFDLIIDCTVDKDISYILQNLSLDKLLFNFSISNHAEQLYCATGKNIYGFIIEMENQILQNEKLDQELYNPIGCWNPTFKAGYNDINVLVQFAIKHINSKFENSEDIRTFVLETNSNKVFNIKCKEF